MDASFVKEIERMGIAGAQVTVDGKLFSVNKMSPVIYEPRPEPLEVNCLTSIRDYLVDNRDEHSMKDMIIHVMSETKASLISKIRGQDRRRDVFITAKAREIGFPYGDYMPLETFIVRLNSQFIQTPESKSLLSFVSSVTLTGENTVIDNGVSQTVNVRVGVKGSLTEPANTPSRVTLMPYRTFSEIDQPESEFVFRMRKEGDSVKVALFEADGGAWKSVAMERIAAWFKESPALKDVSVIS